MKKMVFQKHMYYRDMNVPLYLAGVVYEVEDKMVSRWMKRGGTVVADKAPGGVPFDEVAPEVPVVEVPLVEAPIVEEDPIEEVADEHQTTFNTDEVEEPKAPVGKRQFIRRQKKK